MEIIVVCDNIHMYKMEITNLLLFHPPPPPQDISALF